jgi:GNAT superfamily N-acetyltransferase
MIAITRVSGPQDEAEAARLMRRYAEETGVEACFVALEAELSELSAAFLCVLLARVGGRAAGCVALKALDPGKAELVRLYVEPVHRHGGVGRALIEAAIEDACAGRRHTVVLHTLERWTAATALYRRLGFTPAEPYCDVPLDDVVFFELATAEPARK